MATTTTPKVLTPSNRSLDSTPTDLEKDVTQGKTTWFAIAMGAIASIGGLMFGYESGLISGFLAMPDFRERFAENAKFDATRAGTIVGLLAIGTLIGCLMSGWICDRLGRRKTISASAFFYICGVVIEVTSNRVWGQFAAGRFVAGLGIGALSTAVPMYQSESVPKTIRGVVVSSYQLMITIGLLAAFIANFATVQSYKNSLQWRVPNALSAVWAIVLGIAILFMPESPRFDYRNGKKEEARNVLARLNGVAPDSALINAEIAEIEAKLVEEQATASGGSIMEIFTGPRMLYRTVLGMALQAGQQLTGANFFFYFGTTVFAQIGLSNSFVTTIILGAVNVGATIGGLYLIEKVGRRKALIGGALWMSACFIVYTFVGTYANPVENKAAGTMLIVFTCLFICAFAATWGPLVWAVVSELYPPQHRAPCMALATASNWLLNFAISFTTTFIVAQIKYWYGLVFAVSCLIMALVVYLFVIESKDRSLEEIDTMYIEKVSPRESAKWQSSTRPDVIAGEV